MIKSSEISDNLTDPSSIGLLHPIIYIMIDQNLRAAVTSLWRVDQEMASVLRNVTDPHLQLMRLVWWRDRLEALEAGEGAPAHPVLQALAHAYEDREDIKGLHQIADIWADFSEAPILDEAVARDFAARRGRWLFTRSAALLGSAAPDDAGESGVNWGMNDVASHVSDQALAASLFAQSLDVQTLQSKVKLPKPLLAALKLSYRRAKSGGQMHPLTEQAMLLRISLFGA